MKRRIEIPKGLRCKECGSEELRGAGTEWKANPHGSKPPRVKVQRWRCRNCGLIFLDGEVGTKSGGTKVK